MVLTSSNRINNTKKETPSEGIEPPASEPESEVLSITPRGHINKYICNFFHYTDGILYFQL